jgi:hypothetical protein
MDRLTPRVVRRFLGGKRLDELRRRQDAEAQAKWQKGGKTKFVRWVDSVLDALNEMAGAVVLYSIVKDQQTFSDRDRSGQKLHQLVALDYSTFGSPHPEEPISSGTFEPLKTVQMTPRHREAAAVQLITRTVNDLEIRTSMYEGSHRRMEGSSGEYDRDAKVIKDALSVVKSSP